MIDKLYFFEIPVYRREEDAHYKELNQISNKIKTQYHKRLAKKGLTPEQLPSSVKVINGIESYVIYDWRYNEVIRWIRLYIWSGQIRGDAWTIDAKRFVGRSRKQFIYTSKAFELFIPLNLTSKQILHRLINSLEEMNKDRWYKNRFIDISLLKNLGGYINWKQLMQFHHKRSIGLHPT